MTKRKIFEQDSAHNTRCSGPFWILGRNDLDRSPVFSRPLDRKPDLILIAALFNATDMNAGNIAYAEAFADNTIECVHPLSPFRGLETSLWFFMDRTRKNGAERSMPTPAFVSQCLPPAEPSEALCTPSPTKIRLTN